MSAASDIRVSGAPTGAQAGARHGDTIADPMPRGGFLAAHWRGELPLGRSLWLHAVLAGGLAGLAATALSVLVDVTAGSVRLMAAAALLAWPLALACQAWGIVGAWRSAARQGSARSPWMGLAARGLLVLIGGVALAAAAWHDLPRTATLARLVLGSDPQGQAAVSLSDDGHRLHLRGWLAPGDAARVQQAMAGAPAVRVLEVDLAGGRFQEALQLADMLRGQGWTVRVRGACRDACALVLMAGAVRQLMPDAQWGIARPAAVSANPLFKPLVRQRLAALYAAAGVPAPLVKTGMALPHDFQWRAAWDELAAAGVVTTRPYPLDVALPRGREAPLAELADTLRSHPRWQGLDRRFPGTLAAAAERLHGARAGGADHDAAMLAALETLEPVLAKLLFNASPELREQFAQLLLQALQAPRAEGSTACVGLLAGAAGARRAMPAALAAREAVWMADAAAEQPRETPPRVPSGIELEVVRRWLGADAPALLAGLRHPGDVGVRHCERMAALLAHVLQLPPGERRLALRMAFERP
jgi:hypothetical protein